MRRKATDGLEDEVPSTPVSTETTFDASILNDDLDAQTAELGLMGNFGNVSYLPTSLNPIKSGRLPKTKKSKPSHGDDDDFGADNDLFGGESASKRRAGRAEGNSDYRFGNSDSEEDGNAGDFDISASDYGNMDLPDQLRRQRDIAIPKGQRSRSEQDRISMHQPSGGLLDSLALAGSAPLDDGHIPNGLPRLNHLHGLPPMPMTMTMPMPVPLPPMPPMTVPMHNFPGDVYVPPSAALAPSNNDPAASFDHLPWLHLTEACEQQQIEKDEPLSMDHYTNKLQMTGSGAYGVFHMPSHQNQSVLDPALAAEDSKAGDIKVHKFSSDIKVE